MNELEDRRVVVTGACGVFGRRFAAAFAEQGSRLFLSDNRGQLLEQARKALPGEGHRTHATELTSPASIDALIDRVAAEWGGADIVISNAGVYPNGHLIDLAVGEWDRIWNVNLRAPFLIGRGFATLMAGREIAGSILNIGSGAARNVRAGAVPYSASKAALELLTKGMAIEFAPFGIRVNLLEPGFAPGSEVSPLSEEYVAGVLDHIPLGRASGPFDAPAAALFLSSGAAEFITGATLSVDGGNSIGAAATYPEDMRERLERRCRD